MSLHRVFSYGTLQQDSVQKDLFGRLLEGESLEIRGFQVQDVKITDPEVIRLSGKDIHPGIQRTHDKSHVVSGTLLLVTQQELEKMDHYEVSDYKRIKVHQDGKSFWLYSL